MDNLFALILILLHFVDLFKILFLVGAEVPRSNLLVENQILLKLYVLLLQQGKLLTKLLEELLDNTSELHDLNLPIAGAFGVLLLKEVLQLTVYAEVVFDLEKLLAVAIGDLLGLIELVLMVLLQRLDDLLVAGAVIAWVARGWTAHFRSAILGDFRARQLQLITIFKIVPLNFALGYLK